MLFLGCDGGCTKYAYALADESGHVLASTREEGFNYQLERGERFDSRLKAHLSRLLAAAGAKADDVTYAAYGLAGYDEGPGVNADMRRAVSEALGHDRVRLCSDAVLGWSGALGSQAGINVVSGTGSIAYGEDEAGGAARCGGWSLEFGDEGSSCWIGKMGLNAFFRQSDGRMARTLLYDWFMRYFKLEDPLHLAQIVYDYMAGDFSRCASLQYEMKKLWEQQEPCALQIYKQAAQELGQLVAALRDRLQLQERPFKVSFSGGLFKAGACILSPFTEIVEELGGKLTAPLYGPLVGAIGLAARSHLQGEQLAEMLQKVHESVGI